MGYKEFEDKFPSVMTDESALELMGASPDAVQDMMVEKCVDKQRVKTVLDRILFGDKWADKEYAYAQLGLDNHLMPEKTEDMGLILKRSSWENLFECIRAQNPAMKVEGNFWAAVQSLESQHYIKTKEVVDKI